MEVLDLYSLKGEKTGSVTVPTEMVNYCPNPDAVYFAIKGYQRSHRQGTARVKTRGEVAATTAKPWRQKGTGRARAGMSSSPIWRGGGTVFGPSGELGAYKVNRKTRQAAVRSLLCQCISENKMIVVENMYEAGDDRVPRTKNVAAALKALKLDGKKVLLLNDEKDDVLWKAARNIERVSLKTVKQLNVNDIMNAEFIVTSKKSLESMKELF